MPRFSAIFFLTIFVMSLRGYSFEVHYCHGEITDLALFGHADCVCETATDIVDKKEEMPCHKKKTTPAKESVSGKKECCKTEYLTYTTVKLKAAASFKIDLIKKIAILNPQFLLELIGIYPPVEGIREYIPPLPKRDLPVLFRTLLI